MRFIIVLSRTIRQRGELIVVAHLFVGIVIIAARGRVPRRLFGS
jgi:hypothetical protein